MGSFANYLEDELLDHVFGMGGRDFTPPTNIFIALSTADPTDDGSGLAEPSAGEYGRIQTVAADWTVSSAGAIENVNEEAFAEAAESWGVIAFFALMDAVSGGNMLVHGAISPSQDISIGSTARFVAGDLDVSLD